MFITGVVLIGIASLCITAFKMVVAVIQAVLLPAPLWIKVLAGAELIAVITALVNLILVYFVNF
tara:strand:+ start:5822 stop:6013 length:192 start_codon:yes stop_codon:yes gene_type:complete